MGEDKACPEEAGRSFETPFDKLRAPQEIGQPSRRRGGEGIIKISPSPLSPPTKGGEVVFPSHPSIVGVRSLRHGSGQVIEPDPPEAEERAPMNIGAPTINRPGEREL